MSDDLLVPEGWTRTTLGRLGRYLNGRAFKTSEWSKTGRPIIRIQDLTGSNRNPNYFEGEVEDRYVVQPGDFLVSWSATLGAYIWDGPEAVLNQHIFKVESSIDKRFHYHLMRERIGELERNAHGSGMVHVTKGIFDDTPVAVPNDIDAQRQLADLIDRTDEQHGSCAAHLATAKRTVNRFRQAVLVAACSGRITTDWRDANERAAVSGDLASTAAPSDADEMEVPPSWVVTRVADIGTVQLGGTPSRTRPDYWNGDVRWASSGEVANCRISDTREMISQLGLSNSSAKVYPVGTVLIAMIGEGKTRGQAAILDIEAATNQNAAGILADRRFIDPEYLWRWALAQYETTRAAGMGGNQPALSKQRIADLIIPVPPLDEQIEIVQCIEQLLRSIDDIGSRIDQAAKRVERSCQAVLSKAFRGELSQLKREFSLS